MMQVTTAKGLGVSGKAKMTHPNSPELIRNERMLLKSKSTQCHGNQITFSAGRWA